MGVQRYKRLAAEKKSPFWTRKVNIELFKDGKTPLQKHIARIKSRWDPYNRYRTKEDILKFFDGHDYRRFILIDHENFARFSIKKTLECHPHDHFEVTGDIMTQKSMVRQSKEPVDLESLAEVIKAEGHQDVEAEAPREAATRPNKSDDNEPIQEISAAAQSFIAASPNSLGPPILPCATHLKAIKCGQYGSNKSTVWMSPFLPKLDYTEGRRGLLDHQVTAIVWLLSRLFGDLPTLKCPDPLTRTTFSNMQTINDEDNRGRLKGPKYFGGILADSMGLGKTLITVALIDLMISQGLNVTKTEDGTTEHRPILLVAPSATVASQWVQELREGQGNEDRVRHIELEEFRRWPQSLLYVWDKADSNASRVILIATMDCWARRTCFEDSDTGWHSSFAKKGRDFSLVIVDEAHKVKNHRTRNWRSIYLLKRQFTLLITATPCLNSLADMFGLARLLWTSPEDYLKQSPSNWQEIQKNYWKLEHLNLLDGYPRSSDFQLVAGRPGLLAKLLFARGGSRTQDIQLTRQHLRHFEALAMLRRSPNSCIYADWEDASPVPLNGIFPRVANYTVDINAGEDYDRAYQKVHIYHLIRYLEGLNDWGGAASKEERNKRRVPIMNCTRLLQMASSSLDVYDFDTILSENGHSTLSPKVARMRENGVDLPCLAHYLVLPGQPEPDTHVGWMRVAARNSPILRYMLHYINENILTRENNSPIKKLLIIEDNVMVAFYYERVLQFLGFKCRCLHAKLSLEERQELVNSFNSSDNESCQFLIQSYTVGFAGTNLHKSCSRVLAVAQSHSLQVQWQAIHRVIRVGQTSDVTVHRVKVNNSFHAFRESRQIEKILPELGSRAQGSTKKVLVQLLNLFQSEVNKAWRSPEGQKLRYERNLLYDERVEEEAGSPALKKVKTKEEDIKEKSIKKENTKKEDAKKEDIKKQDIKMVVIKKKDTKEEFTKKEELKKIIIKNNGTQKVAIKKERVWEEEDKKTGIKKEEPKNEKSQGQVIKKEEPQKIKKEEEEEEESLWEISTSEKHQKHDLASTSSKKRKQKTVVPKTGDGSGGWYNMSDPSDDEAAFLALQTRNAYYAGFVRLRPEVKSIFDHSKNNLRRLLSYGYADGKLSTRPWTENDLEHPAVLERALELMLRVRLAAKDIAMLPIPMIDLSKASPTRRARLHNLLADIQHTHQDLQESQASGSGGKDAREMLRSTNLDQHPDLIELDLEVQARLGEDAGRYKTAAVKKEIVERERESYMDLTGLSDDEGASMAEDMSVEEEEDDGSVKEEEEDMDADEEDNGEGQEDEEDADSRDPSPTWSEIDRDLDANFVWRPGCF